MSKWVGEGKGQGGRKGPAQSEGTGERGRARGEEKGYGRKDETGEKGTVRE